MSNNSVSYYDNSWVWLPERNQLRIGWLGSDHIYEAELHGQDQAPGELREAAQDLDDTAAMLREMADRIESEALHA